MHEHMIRNVATLCESMITRSFVYLGTRGLGKFMIPTHKRTFFFHRTVVVFSHLPPFRELNQFPV